MQEAVTLFPHSISHSNNGEQLISIEFLPLFNRFIVLFELSKRASKASFQIPALFLFCLPYDQSTLWIMVAVLKRKKYGQLKQIFFYVKENIREHEQNSTHKSYLELNM